MKIDLHKFNTSSILVFSLILMSSFVMLVSKFYKSALDEAISYHQQLQSEMAKSATTSIQMYFQSLDDDLQFMSRMKTSDLSLFLTTEQMQAQGIKAWFTLDNNLQIDHFYGDPSLNWIGFSNQLQALKPATEPGALRTESRLHFTPVYPEDRVTEDAHFEFLILHMPEPGVAKFPGAGDKNLGLVVNFDDLMERFVAPLKLGDDDFAWIMDGTGRLIYHPRHREMLLHSIGELQEDCVACHSSFSIQEQMIREGHGKAAYLIEGEPEKIMAYAPIDFGDLKWVLAISTYSPSVVRDVLRNSISIFILSAGFLVLLILAGGSLYILNLRRIRAEEARKRLQQVQGIQEKLDQASKLASLGELIDSVAHEINTPTGIISVVTDALLLDEPEGSLLRKELGIIMNQVHRIRVYTKRLLGYSRVMPFAPQKNDVVELTEECLFLLGPRLREKQVEVHNALPKDCPRYAFDRPRLEQVILNLLNNAIDFIEPRGIITISFRTESAEPEQGGQRWHVLSIQDNGSGIQPADLPHVFEPFYSKRPSASGTGLGLSISKSIVERHGGRLEVRSEPGLGATFSIYLLAEEA